MSWIPRTPRFAILVALATMMLAAGCSSTSSTIAQGTATATASVTPASPTSTSEASCATLLPGSTPLGSIAQFSEVTLPAGTNPVATGPTTAGGGSGQFSVMTYNVCFTGSISDVTGPVSAHNSLLATLLGAGWGLTPNSFPFDTEYQQPCSSGQTCFFSGAKVTGRQVEVDSLTALANQLVTFRLNLAMPPAAPSCNAGFYSSPMQGIQTTASTSYGVVPLPPVSYASPDNYTGHGGTVFCSAGTAATISSFLATYMPQSGWSLYSSDNGQTAWKSSNGCIEMSVSDPTGWYISWPNPAFGQPFADC